MTDSELRVLELDVPAWSIREPLDMSLDRAGSYPTIETALKREEARHVSAAAGDGTLESVRLQEAESPSISDGARAAGRPSGERPLPSQFFLDGRPTFDSRPRGHARTTSETLSFTSERGTTASPRVFPLVPAKFSTPPRRHTIFPLANQSVDCLPTHTVSPEGRKPLETLPAMASLETPENMPHEQPHIEDILKESNEPRRPDALELTSPVTSPPVEAVQRPLASLGDAVPVPMTPILEPRSAILLARDRAATGDRARSSVGGRDAATLDGKDSATPMDGQQTDEDPPTFDHFTGDNIDGSEFGGTASQRNSENEPDEEDERLNAASIGPEGESGTVPSTPALSSGSDSSPRYSIIMTPTMMRTGALASDNISAVSNLDHAKWEHSPQPDETAGHEGEGTPFHVSDLNLKQKGQAEPSSAVRQLQLPGHDQETRQPTEAPTTTATGHEVMLEVSAHTESVDNSMVTFTGATDIDDEEQSVTVPAGSILEEASMIQLPSSPPMPAVEDAHSEIPEASMTELPSLPPSPTLESTEIASTADKDANGGNTYGRTPYLESSLVEGDQALETEKDMVDQGGVAADRVSVSQTVLPGPAGIQLAPSRDIRTVPEDGMPDDVFGASLTKPQRTSWYDEVSSSIADYYATDPGPQPSLPMSSTEEDRLLIEAVDVYHPEEATTDIGASGAAGETCDLEPDAREPEVDVDDIFGSKTESSGLLWEEVEPSPLPEAGAGEPGLERKDTPISKVTSAVDYKDYSLHMEAFGDASTPSGEVAFVERSSLPFLAGKPVDAEDAEVNDTDEAAFESDPDHEEAEKSLVEEEDRPASEPHTNADHKDGPLNARDVVGGHDAATAGVVPEDPVQAGVAVQLSPPENHIGEESLGLEDFAGTRDHEGRNSEEDSHAFDTATSNPPIDSLDRNAVAESATSDLKIPCAESEASVLLPETGIASVPSAPGDHDVSDLDIEKATTATGTGYKPGLQEEEPASINSETDANAIKAHTRVHSDAPDLPSLFAPAISHWLLSDHHFPEATESVEDRHPYDVERTARFDAPSHEMESPDVATHPEAERPTQLARRYTPYLAAEEVADPLERPQPDDSISNVDQTEDLDSSPFEAATTALPQTPRRQFTFPIPTPFSLRTSAVSPHPPSPVLSHRSFSPRSSFSSNRPSISAARDSVDTISLARDSVDTIAPLPSPFEEEDSHHAEKEYRPSTGSSLGIRGATRHFASPFHHVWDPSSFSERGSRTSRPGTPNSTATARPYSSYKRRRGEMKRPRLLSDASRPATSHGVLETLRAEEDGARKGGVASRFVMLFAGVEYARRALGGDERENGP